MSYLDLRIASLHVYPVKSCAGVSLDESLLIETGFEFDRAWMLVDAGGVFVSQRELPRMALVQPTLKVHEMVLRAPGMLALHIALDAVEKPLRVRVWNDEVAAFDMGDLAAQWFSDFLGRALRMVRFNPDHKRLSDPLWSGGIDAETAFADAFSLLVASTAGLAELNRRLHLAGEAPVTMARLRPNIVLDGLDAHGEDHLDEISFDSADGPVTLRLVKPCTRCQIPDIDPVTATPGHAVGEALRSYRADPRMSGALTFGMNAVIAQGIDCSLRVGMAGRGTVRFN